jgi:putative membrane protein
MATAAMAAVGAVLPLADGWHHGWGGGPWFLLFPLFWGLVILTIIWLVRGSPPWRRRRSDTHQIETGVQVLERRFAEGGVSADEYRERRAVLEERRSGGRSQSGD